MAGDNKISISRLIAVPALITLAVTLLRLVGELEHWGKLGFNNAVGGGGALVGISWLPFIFGPYFAVKLANRGERWSSGKRAWGYWGLGFVILFASGALMALVASKNLHALEIAGYAGMLVAAFVMTVGWRELGRTLIAYAFAARIPVLVVMFLAMRGNGGAGWGTHYDAVEPGFASASFAGKFFYLAFLPQMFFWIAWTVLVGALTGFIAFAIVRRKNAAASSASA
jgi:hypothetical protein